MRDTQCFDIDLRHLGKALAARPGVGQIETRFENNLGLGILREGEGSIEIAVGDEIVGDTPVDFIKIDVEGHEMAVLSGLNSCIGNRRPTIFIEVDNKNSEAFSTAS